MAETGITNETGSSASRNSSSGKSFFKKNKVAVLGGGGLIALLVMGHKGSSSSNGSTNTTALQDQLQQQSDMLTAEQSALQSGGAVYPGSLSDTGGGSGGNSGGSGGGDPAIDPATGNTWASEGLGPNGTPPTYSTQPDYPPPGTPPVTPPMPTQTTPTPTTPSGTPHPTKPKAGKGHPAPSGKHKGTGEVSNPVHKGGHGHGVTVHGRTFPGGKHATVHGAHKVGKDVHQKVTVNHGGHTTHHTSVNGGQRWIDHPKGSSVPSRHAAASAGLGRVRAIAHPPAPAPVHRPAPARRAAPARKR